MAVDKAGVGTAAHAATAAAETTHQQLPDAYHLPNGGASANRVCTARRWARAQTWPPGGGDAAVAARRLQHCTPSGVVAQHNDVNLPPVSLVAADQGSLACGIPASVCDGAHDVDGKFKRDTRSERSQLHAHVPATQPIAKYRLYNGEIKWASGAKREKHGSAGSATHQQKQDDPCGL